METGSYFTIRWHWIGSTGQRFYESPVAEMAEPKR